MLHSLDLLKNRVAELLYNTRIDRRYRIKLIVGQYDNLCRDRFELLNLCGEVDIIEDKSLPVVEVDFHFVPVVSGPRTDTEDYDLFIPVKEWLLTIVSNRSSAFILFFVIGYIIDNSM